MSKRKMTQRADMLGAWAIGKFTDFHHDCPDHGVEIYRGKIVEVLHAAYPQLELLDESTVITPNVVTVVGLHFYTDPDSVGLIQADLSPEHMVTVWDH